MSAFERRRLENIATNQALLNNAAAVAKKITPKTTPKSTPTRAKSRTRSTPVKRESSRPTRMSSRLAGLDADNETLKRKMKVEEETAAEQAKAKKMRVSGDLNLGDITVDGKKWVAGIGGLKGIIRGAQPGVRTFTEDDLTETTDKGLKDLRLRMGGLKLYEQWAPNGKFLEALVTIMILTGIPRHQDHSPTGLCPWISPHRIQAHHFRRR